MVVFSDPRGWWLLVVWVAFFLVFVRKIRRRRVIVTTLFLLRPLVDSTAVLKRRFRLLRRLAFLCFLAAGLLAALAGPGPFLATGARPRREMIVADLSPSLGIAHGKGSRLAALRGTMLDYEEELHAGDLVWLVTAGPRAGATPSLPPGRLLKEALEELEPADAPADISGALELAASVRGVERTLIFTDRPGRWSGKVLASLRGVRFVTLGKKTANAGIAAFDLERDPAKRESFDVYVKAGFWSDGTEDESELHITLLNNGERVETFGKSCATGATVEFVARGLSLEPGVLEARLEPGGAYAADDTAMAAVMRDERLRVTAVTDGNPFLEQAILAEQGIDGSFVLPGDYTPADPEAVYIFDGTVPSGELPRRALFILPDKEIGDVRLGNMRLAENLVEWDRSDPVLRAVDLDDLSVNSFLELEEGHGYRAPAFMDGFPLLLLGGGERFWAVQAFDPSDSSFVYSPAYPILMTNLIRWIGATVEAEERFLSAGEVVHLPSEAAGGVFRSPDGATQLLPHDGGGLSLRADKAGRYRVSGADGEELGDFFVNVLDARVSAEIAADGYGLGPPGLPEGLERRPASVSLVPMAALLALFFLAVEAVLSRGQSSGREQT